MHRLPVEEPVLLEVGVKRLARRTHHRTQEAHQISDVVVPDEAKAFKYRPHAFLNVRRSRDPLLQVVVLPLPRLLKIKMALYVVNSANRQSLDLYGQN